VAISTGVNGMLGKSTWAGRYFVSRRTPSVNSIIINIGANNIQKIFRGVSGGITDSIKGAALGLDTSGTLGGLDTAYGAIKDVPTGSFSKHVAGTASKIYDGFAEAYMAGVAEVAHAHNQEWVLNGTRLFVCGGFVKIQCQRDKIILEGHASDDIGHIFNLARYIEQTHSVGNNARATAPSILAQTARMCSDYASRSAMTYK
jgi:hypothetical protein